MQSRLMLGHTLQTAASVARPRELWHEGEGHLITVAPTGAGKGVSNIIPALLTWRGPAVVIDPKGENAAVTLAYRESLGQSVYVLDPFNLTGRSSDSLNPFDLIDPDGLTAIDDAVLIARLAAQGMCHKHDPFWDERASTLISGLILYVLQSGQEANLGDVRSLIEQSEPGLSILANHLCAHPVLEVRAAGAVLSPALASKTRASIIATASSHLSFVRQGVSLLSLSQSTIPLADVLSGEPLTLYLVIPPDKLLSHGKLLRLWMGTILATLSRRRRKPASPTLLLIDEASQLGPLDELRAAITLMRGYGVKVWTFWQDLSQLRRTYPDDWQSILNNCAIQQFFGAASPMAAREVSDYLAGYSPGSLLTLPPDGCIHVESGRLPRVVRRVDYLSDPMMSKRANPNPFYAAPNRQPAAVIPLLRDGRASD